MTITDTLEFRELALCIAAVSFETDDAAEACNNSYTKQKMALTAHAVNARKRSGENAYHPDL
ncbi:MAG: hypothetical protein ACKO51_16845 [Alphaproteobacteria bacterium]